MHRPSIKKSVYKQTNSNVDKVFNVLFKLTFGGQEVVWTTISSLKKQQKAFWKIVSFKLSFIWLISTFILSLSLNTKLKTKNNRSLKTNYFPECFVRKWKRFYIFSINIGWEWSFWQQWWPRNSNRCWTSNPDFINSSWSDEMLKIPVQFRFKIISCLQI